VRTLVQDNLAKGSHSIIFDAQNLPSGVYTCVLRGAYQSASVRMVLMK
jgi:hypothetical protein